MLEFNYEGERYFANVIEYRHSPAVYYVNLINATHLRPRRMIFEEVGNKIELSPDSMPVRENLVKAIVAKIEEHLENPSSPRWENQPRDFVQDRSDYRSSLPLLFSWG